MTIKVKTELPKGKGAFDDLTKIEVIPESTTKEDINIINAMENLDDAIPKVEPEIIHQFVEDIDDFIFQTISRYMGRDELLSKTPISKKMLMRALYCYRTEHTDEYEQLANESYERTNGNGYLYYNMNQVIIDEFAEKLKRQIKNKLDDTGWVDCSIDRLMSVIDNVRVKALEEKE